MEMGSSLLLTLARLPSRLLGTIFYRFPPKAVLGVIDRPTILIEHVYFPALHFIGKPKELIDQ